MKSYRLAIADAPKKNIARIRAEYNNTRFTSALARLLDRHPALCSASGSLSYSLAIALELLISTRQGTRSVASGGVASLEVSDAS